ncbi:MAG TPA: hypothetical protein VFT82_00815 [Candidatus Paceibacterota bacterium]|nr:hypothetical protein [Candidatus Paceibacterota bacterium]
MKESFPTQESGEEVKREDVLAVYRKFVDRGETNPDSLDLSDPEVKEANDLFFRWVNQEDERVKGDRELELRNNLSKTMFYVDAGFTDKHYLEGVLSWLSEDAYGTEKDQTDPERVKTRAMMAEAMKKVRRILGEDNAEETSK